MREEALKRFFLAEIDAKELAKDVSGSRRQVSDTVSIVNIEDMEGELRVTRPMLISLCDAVASGQLEPGALAAIGFALESSDRFIWDGDEDDLLANVIADWSCPEVNYPLTLENVRRFRGWLDGTELYPPRPSATTVYDGKVVSIVEKKSIERHRRRIFKKS